jgi:hypothetical protein
MRPVRPHRRRPGRRGLRPIIGVPRERRLERTTSAARYAFMKRVAARLALPMERCW